MAARRRVSLSGDVYGMAVRRAEVDGLRVPAWIAEAIKDKALRDAGMSAAKASARPEVAKELADFHAWAGAAMVERGKAG
jgi:hypothetical protein